jgi:SAM-dependent methyltransferase
MAREGWMGSAYWERRAGDWRPAHLFAPAAEDIRRAEAQARACAEALGRPLQALMLGPTPGIADMDWPAGSDLTAVDWADGMLRHVLPARHRTRAVRADWRALPLADDCVDFAIGDNCFMVQGSLADADRVGREVDRVLRPGGLFCVRALFRPDALPTPTDLIDRLRAGEIGEPEFFRWQFAMAIQGQSPDGVDLGAVWRAWWTAVPDPAALCRRQGWPEHAFISFERWRGLDCRYTFPSRADLRALTVRGFDILGDEVAAVFGDFGFARLVLRGRGG